MEYRIIRSARRTLALQVEKTGEILVRAPYSITAERIEAFVCEHADWIEKQRSRISAKILPPLTDSEIAALRARAKADLPARTA